MRVVDTVRRYIRNLKTRCDMKRDRTVATASRVEEWQKVESYLIRMIQEDAYLKEISTLKNGKSAVVDRKSDIRKLNPILKDDLL